MKNRISFNTKNSIHFVDPDEIVYCKSSNSSTIICLKDKERIVISKGLKTIENLINAKKFIRPHQSYLVNMNHIILVDKAKDYSLILTNKERIPIAVRRRKAILKNIKSAHKLYTNS